MVYDPVAFLFAILRSPSQKRFDFFRAYTIFGQPKIENLTGECHVPQHKSCKKRMKTSEKARRANRAVRSAIRTSLKVIRTSEDLEQIKGEVPRLYSLMDKAARKHRAGFNKNRVANYKSKVSKLIAARAAA